MANSIISTGNISLMLVFAEGLLSFFSPCVVPLIPVYLGYLAGDTDFTKQGSRYVYKRKKILFHTFCFVLGISFSFFILGISFTVIGKLLQEKRYLFTRFAGIIIIALGLFQLGILNIKFLNRERRFQLKLGKKSVNPFIALLMGFTFSFAWTPCVGPALSSVLILASTSGSSLFGNALVLLYTLGFAVPFLLLGLFTTQVLNFLHNFKNLIQYTAKAGGIILIIIGIMTITDWINGVSNYLNFITSNTPEYNQAEQKLPETAEEQTNIREENNPSQEEEKTNTLIPAFDFTLSDQYGNSHTLSAYKDKVVFLNFWATWCPPCREEMPAIQELYEQYNHNQGEVIFLGVAEPKTEENAYTKEVDKAGVIAFLEENGYTFPIVFDETGEIYGKYNITSLPTTFLIDKNGNLFGYAPGMLTKDMMKSAIENTLSSTGY